MGGQGGRRGGQVGGATLWNATVSDCASRGAAAERGTAGRLRPRRRLASESAPLRPLSTSKSLFATLTVLTTPPSSSSASALTESSTSKTGSSAAPRPTASSAAPTSCCAPSADDKSTSAWLAALASGADDEEAYGAASVASTTLTRCASYAPCAGKSLCGSCSAQSSTTRCGCAGRRGGAAGVESAEAMKCRRTTSDGCRSVSLRTSRGACCEVLAGGASRFASAASSMMERKERVLPVEQTSAHSPSQADSDKYSRLSQPDRDDSIGTKWLLHCGNPQKPSRPRLLPLARKSTPLLRTHHDSCALT